MPNPIGARYTPIGNVIEQNGRTRATASAGQLLVDLMRPNLHEVLHRRSPLVLAVCGTLLILTLLLARFSFVFFGIGIAVGLLYGVISADELTGGKVLSLFSVPLLIVGRIVAEIVSGTRASVGLTLQYMLVAFCVDMMIVLLFRRQIERFVATRRPSKS